MELDLLRQQYEAYPYPARDPKDEAKRLIAGSPSDLDEIIHYVFGGRLERSRPLRVLVAGGGTGDAAIMLAQQAADAGVPLEMTYVDLSTTSRQIAEERAKARGLTSITFHTGSFLEDEPAGPFDYIDSCGVIHHLPDPVEALRTLAGKLAPGGGIGLMVYGASGRTGVYALQDALRRLGQGMNAADQVALAKRTIANLPKGNWFKRNPFLGDHAASDAGLYDLLLHSQDRAYTVPEFLELVEGAGLAVASMIEPARYEPATYVNDPKVLGRLAVLEWQDRAAIAETLAGSFTKHIAYLVRPERLDSAVARPDQPAFVPVLKRLDGAAVARNLKPGAGLVADIASYKVNLPLPRLAGPILARIDGKRTLQGIFEDMEADGLCKDRPEFEAQFNALYRVLNGLNMLLLRRDTTA